VLFIPNNPPGLAEGRAVQDAAEAIGQVLEMLRASTPNQIDEAFATIEQQHIGALIVSPIPFSFPSALSSWS
jgi:hypothetical protein